VRLGGQGGIMMAKVGGCGCGREVGEWTGGMEGRGWWFWGVAGLGVMGVG
jgi:hypothetical protein